jgi:hypothetical protein
MKDVIPLMAGGAGLMVWAALPRWAQILAAGGIIALGVIGLTRDGNEAFYSGSIFGGQAALGDAQTSIVAKVEADLAAKKPVTNATAAATATYEGLAAEANQKGIYADSAVESQAELLAKKAKGIPLSSTEELRLKELRIQEAQAILQETIAADAQQYMSALRTIRAEQGKNDPFKVFEPH